ncbi:MAG: MATE family efflux transporter, partial [Peptostreptococcaceae bacterium]
ISWMTADGIAVALSSFVGQNYGANKYDRINKGFKITLAIGTVLGIVTTLILIFGGKQIFTVFINEAETINEGASYLKILGYSQLFMCVEIITSGAFKGIGRTYIPSIILTILTGARVPMAYFLSRPEILGLSGVWWSISISSVIKGLLLIGVYLYLLKTNKLYKSSEHKVKPKTVLR